MQIAERLVVALRSTNSFDARGTIIELLTKLFHKHKNCMSSIIDVVFPDLIALRLDEDVGAGRARLSALKLLACRASSLSGE